MLQVLFVLLTMVRLLPRVLPSRPERSFLCDILDVLSFRGVGVSAAGAVHATITVPATPFLWINHVTRCSKYLLLVEYLKQLLLLVLLCFVRGSNSFAARSNRASVINYYRSSRLFPSPSFVVNFPLGSGLGPSSFLQVSPYTGPWSVELVIF